MRVATVLLFLLLGQAPAPATDAFRAVFQRGLEALASGQLDAAQAAFQEAQRLQPENPAVYYQLGEVHAQRQEFGEAIVNFRQAIELEPREPQSYFRLAVLQTKLHRFHDAQQTLKELQRVRPGYPETYLLLGRVAEEQGDHTLAEGHLRHYLQLRPGDPTGLGELGVTLLAQEKFQEAETLLGQVLEKDPNSGPAHLNFGLLYSRRGEDETARHHLEAATRLMPENAQAYYELGTILVRLGETAEAEGAFRKAASLSPDYAEAHYALGTLLRRSGRAEEAAKVLVEHERLSASALEDRQRSRRVSAFHLDVRKLLEEDRLEEAEAKLRSILELDPQNDLAYYRLGQIQFLRADYARSLESIRLALGLKDFEPSYYFLEAMCLERLGRDSEAAAAYQRLLSLVEYADAYGGLARLELRQGNAEKAVANLRRAVALEPESPELRLALAEALESAGDYAESQKQRAEAERLREKSNQR